MLSVWVLPRLRSSSSAIAARNCAEPALRHVVGQRHEAVVEELLALGFGQHGGRMLQHVLRLHGVLRSLLCGRLCLAVGVGGNGRGERVEWRAVSPAGFFFRHRRADEAHRQAAHDALALADRDADALQAAAARQDREGVAVAPDALEGGASFASGARRDRAARRGVPRPSRRRARRGRARSTGSGCGAAAPRVRTTSGFPPPSNGGSSSRGC